MMALKLEQSKLSRRLDGVARRGGESDSATAALQASQVALSAQLTGLAARLDSLVQQTAAAEAWLARLSAAIGTGGPRQGGGDGSGTARTGGRSSADGAPLQVAGVQVCHAHGPQARQHTPALRLPRPAVQWTVVAGLAGSAALALSLLLHPSGTRLPRTLRGAIACLALLNALMAAALLAWLVLLHGLLSAQLAGMPRMPSRHHTPLLVPAHRMLAGSAP